MKTAALVIGFGGPETPEDVDPFLGNVLEGVNLPPERLGEVKDHYRRVGGVSPYVGAARAFAKALAVELPGTHVGVAFRHSPPSFNQVLSDLHAGGVRRVAGFVLSPLHAQASYGKYLDKMSTAAERVGFSGVIRYADEFRSEERYLAALADRAREAGACEPGSHVIFSAHSIPAAMPDSAEYARQFSGIASAVASRLGVAAFTAAYQSRSGNPADPWLGPDVFEALAFVPKTAKKVVLVPAGFLCENVEITFDLDIELKEAAAAKGLAYARARFVTDHPAFVKLAADLLAKELEAP